MVAAIRPGDKALELEGAIARSQENISFFSLASFSLLGSPGTIHGHRFLTEMAQSVTENTPAIEITTQFRQV